MNNSVFFKSFKFYYLVLFIFFVAQLASGQERPNIIFIMADDLGYAELGSYGQKQIKTPHLDQLASEGMKFSQFYSGSSVCAPARSVLMTGMHTGHTRVRGNFGKGGVVGLAGNKGRVPIKSKDVTVAEVLKTKGYKTGMIGKWGLGEPNTTGEPNKQGFDYFYGFLNQRRAHSYFPEYLWENNKKVILEGNEDQKKTQYTHDLFAEKTMSFLDKNHKSPFFLYLPLCIPHGKYEIPDNGIYSNKEGWTEKQKIYAAMVSKMDETVGRILDRLKKLGIEENTYIFFTSDNGAAEVENDWKLFESSGIYRGMKRDPYEGGIRVPLIAWHPKKIKANTSSDQIGYFADFLPTIADLAGVDPIVKVDGVSISSVLHGKGNKIKERYLYWEFYEKKGWRATRFGKWKAIQKNMHKGDQGAIEVYDLENDPSEKNDISSVNSKVLKKAKRIFEEAHVPSEHYVWKFLNKGDIEVYNK